MTRLRYEQPLVVGLLNEFIFHVEVYSFFHHSFAIDVGVHSIGSLDFLKVWIGVVSLLVEVDEALEPDIGRRERVVHRKIHFENEQVVLSILVIVRQHYCEILVVSYAYVPLILILLTC